MITVHDSDDTEAVVRTTRLLKSFNADETELRIDYYLSRAKDDSLWDHRAAYGKLAAIPFDESYQDKVGRFLATYNSSNSIALENWQEAVLVWGTSDA